MQATATNIAGQATLSKINELAIQAAKDLRLTVINTHCSGQGNQKSLEICIYRQESAINFADCEAMTRSFEQLLEQEKIENTLINISVVSPGIDRRLTTATEFMLFAGKPVRISAREKIDELGIEFTGLLIRGDELSITISHASPLSSKQIGKKNSAQMKVADESTSELTIALSKIYGVYLWPGSKLHSGKQ